MRARGVYIWWMRFRSLDFCSVARCVLYILLSKLHAFHVPGNAADIVSMPLLLLCTRFIYVTSFDYCCVSACVSVSPHFHHWCCLEVFAFLPSPLLSLLWSESPALPDRSHCHPKVGASRQLHFYFHSMRMWNWKRELLIIAQAYGNLSANKFISCYTSVESTNSVDFV